MPNYRFLDSPEKRREKRLIWAAGRSVLENIGMIRKKSGKKSRSHWQLFLFFLKIFALFLRITGYYRKGCGNARSISLESFSLVFPDLPESFSGFRILHLSDLHLDSIPGFTTFITDKIRGLEFDICLLTGDYRFDKSGSFGHILKPLAVLSKYVQATYGAFAVLGNHDTYLMAQFEEGSGLDLLINESVEILKDGQKILITGCDDPYDFYTEPASLCLETKGYDFKIAMVHTPELARIASRNRYDLYLCGHTHGGQICLKKGLPLVSHQFEGKKLNHGTWKIGKMTGYTSRGAGVSGLPVRFNCPPEVTIITLLKESSG